MHLGLTAAFGKPEFTYKASGTFTKNFYRKNLQKDFENKNNRTFKINQNEVCFQ